MPPTNKFRYEELVALGAYCISSLTITLLNKAVLSSSRFGMNFLLLAVQALTSIAMLALFKSFKAIDFRAIKRAESLQCNFKLLLFLFCLYSLVFLLYRVTC